MALFGREPRPPLSAFVSAIWLADGYVPGPHRHERILPTGDCSLIVNLASGVAGVSGPHVQSFIIETASQFSVAGVQFKAGGAFPFFAVPIDELAHLHVPLDAVWGGLDAELRERLFEAATPGAKLDVIEQLLIVSRFIDRPSQTRLRFASSSIAVTN